MRISQPLSGGDSLASTVAVDAGKSDHSPPVFFPAHLIQQPLKGYIFSCC